MKKIKIAIVGQGRSGRDIHGAYFKSDMNQFFDVVAIVETDEERRNRAREEYPGCEVFACHTELYGRDDIDLVTNATMSKDHYSITKDLLEHGFNVVSEKPFARNRYECDNLIKIANEKKSKFGVFHQSLFAPIYTNAKKVIESGILGEIKQIDISYSNFSRRWDWQTAQCEMGGSIYNTGPHPIGYGLGFLDFDENFRVIYTKLDHILSSGDAEDYAKILITAPNKPLIDIEISSIDAFPASTFKIMGTKGTYKSNFVEYEMKYIVDGENPEQPLILTPLKDENGLPAWCSETLITHTESGKFEGSAFDIGTHLFYEMMYNAITKNAEITIKPEYAAMTISVIEQAHAENPLPVKF